MGINDATWRQWITVVPGPAAHLCGDAGKTEPRRAHCRAGKAKFYVLLADPYVTCFRLPAPNDHLTVVLVSAPNSPGESCNAPSGHLRRHGDVEEAILTIIGEPAEPLI